MALPREELCAMGKRGRAWIARDFGWDAIAGKDGSGVFLAFGQSRSPRMGISCLTDDARSSRYRCNRRAAKWTRRELFRRFLWELAQPSAFSSRVISGASGAGCFGSSAPGWAVRFVFTAQFESRYLGTSRSAMRLQSGTACRSIISGRSASARRQQSPRGRIFAPERTTIVGRTCRSQMHDTIGRGAWICADAFVGPNVTVGDFAVLGARAVIVRDVAAGLVVAGNPARVVGRRECFADKASS